MAYAETLEAPPDDADGMTIEGEAAEAGEFEPQAALPVSSLPPGQQFECLSGWWKDDSDHSREWRGECREAFAFRAGEQWSPEDKALLASQSRPVIVFNRVLTILKAVAGMEINGRHEIAFLPRGTEDVKANEVLSAASKWMADSCDGEDEESQSFDHTCTCGMGWVEERMSYEDDPSGLYVEESVDPREMYWDRTAKKQNVLDARRMSRVRRMPLGDALSIFPGRTREQLDAVWANDGPLDYPQKSIEQKRKRDSDNMSMPPYDDSCEVTIVEIQWIEREVYYIVADLQAQSKSELSEKQFKAFKSRMAQLAALALRSGADPAQFEVHAARMTRKVYKSAFLGGSGVMLKKAGPAPIKGQFKWKCITGEYDAARGTWFGLVKLLRDPQMWANKWLAQILHILNSTAKGGIIAERGAFDDEREAEDGYAQPEAITWAADGALSGPSPKIIAKPGSGQMNEAYVGLLAFAISSFKDVSGINHELLGQQDQNQPGILEAMRKQAGMTVLATLFNSLRRFRKQVGRTRLFFIQNFLSDGRLIRVVSPDQVNAIPLAKDKTFGEYDVVVDDTPTSPNQKEANWAIIQPLLAVFKDQLMGNPQVLAMLLEYSPLPARIVEAIKQFVQQGENDPEIKTQKEIAVAGAIAKIEKDKSIANLNNAKAGNAESTAIYEITMAQNLLHDNRRDELASHLNLMATAAKARAEEAKAAASEREHEHEGTRIGIEQTDAGTRRLAAVTAARRVADEGEHKRGSLHNERVGLLIDHLATRSKVERDAAAAHKDRAMAQRGPA